MLDKCRESLCGIVPIHWRSRHCECPMTVFPLHHVIGMRLTPPLRRIHRHAWYEQCVWIRVEHSLASRIDGLPVLGFAWLRPWKAHRERDEIHSRVGRHFDLGHERVRRTAESDEGFARPMKFDVQGPCRSRLRPNPDAIAMTGNDVQIGPMIEMEVGPLSIWRCGESHMQACRTVTTGLRLDGDSSHRVRFVRWPMRPVPIKTGVPVLEIVEWNEVGLPSEILDLKVVEPHVPRARTEAQVHGAVVCRAESREFEFELLPLGPDAKRRPAGSAEKHASTNRLPIDNKARSTARRLHPDIQCRRVNAAQDREREDEASGKNHLIPYDGHREIPSGATHLCFEPVPPQNR